MEVRRTAWELDWGEMGPGWSWDPIYCDLDGVETHAGWRWNANNGTCPWWRWDATLMDVRCKFWTWMDVRLNLDGCEAWIYRPEWRWNRTLIEMRRIYRDLDLGKKGQRCSWATIRVTWMEWRRDLVGGETWISGLGWRWDMIWMEVTHGYRDFDGGEI